MTRMKTGGVPIAILVLALALPLAVGCSAEAVAVRQLRICADPNNLPFSNRNEEGFENDIARLIAEDLGAELSYTWWPQRRGFIRNTLGEDRCDAVMGIPSSTELALATRPYYRSTYVFLSRADRETAITSLDDPVLRELRIGFHLIGDDYNNSPAAAALARRGIIENLAGYSIYGDYSADNPPARLVKAVAEGEVDLAVVWGPIAGYFASLDSVEMELAPVMPQIDLPFVPFVYDISMGVARADTAMKEELEGALQRRRPEIEEILHRYGVPLVGLPQGSGR